MQMILFPMSPSNSKYSFMTFSFRTSKGKRRRIFNAPSKKPKKDQFCSKCDCRAFAFQRTSKVFWQNELDCRENSMVKPIDLLSSANLVVLNRKPSGNNRKRPAKCMLTWVLCFRFLEQDMSTRYTRAEWEVWLFGQWLLRRWQDLIDGALSLSLIHISEPTRPY